MLKNEVGIKNVKKWGGDKKFLKMRWGLKMLKNEVGIKRFKKWGGDEKWGGDNKKLKM